eukprot:superscaffoldBa00000514_g5330
MNGELRALSRAKKAAFRSGDKETYNTARARLKAGIKEAKQRHQQRLERDLYTNNTKDMWQQLLSLQEQLTSKEAELEQAREEHRNLQGEVLTLRDKVLKNNGEAVERTNGELHERNVK